MSKTRLTLFTITILMIFIFTVGIVIAKEETSSSDGKVIKILRTTNKAQILGYVPVVYTFKNVNPHEVVNWFTSALATEEGGCFTFLAPDGASGKMLVICPEHQIPYFDKLAKDLDRPKLDSATGSKLEYYRFKHRNPFDAGLLNVLGTMSNEVLWPDRETNSILLFDAPAGAARGLENLNNILDVPTPMAQINLKIYEATVGNNAALGLDYLAWKNGPGRAAFNFTNNFDYVKSLNIGSYSANTGNFGYYIDYPSAYFDFLVSKNRAKILVDTKLSSMNGTPINFQTGDQILYYEKDARNNLTVKNQNLAASSASLLRLPGTKTDPLGQSSGSQIVTSQPPAIQAASTGINVTITPSISTERINMNLLIRVADLVGYQDNGSPIISSRQMADSIMVPYDTEVMIGDLTREYIVKTVKKVPILGSIPGLGWLFGGENHIKQKSTAIVSIKANIIKDMSNMTADERKVIDQVANYADTPSPKPIIGFDQWLLDNEK